eukprot:gene19933-biopygen4050
MCTSTFCERDHSRWGRGLWARQMCRSTICCRTGCSRGSQDCSLRRVSPAGTPPQGHGYGPAGQPPQG